MSERGILTTNYCYTYYMALRTVADILRSEGLTLAHSSRRVRHDMQSRRRYVQLLITLPP